MRDEGLSRDDLAEAIVWAPEILERFGQEKDDEAVLAELPGVSERMLRIALAYAALLSSDEHLPGAPDHAPSDSELRAHLSTDDLQRIEEFCVYHRRIGLTLLVPTPEQWLERWTKLVETVEASYEWELDELTNDLTARDLFEDAVLLVGPSGRESMRAIIDPLDFRYEAATTSSDVSLMGSQAPWELRRWWWFRVPIRCGPRLAEDVRARGIVKGM